MAPQRSLLTPQSRNKSFWSDCDSRWLAVRVRIEEWGNIGCTRLSWTKNFLSPASCLTNRYDSQSCTDWMRSAKYCAHQSIIWVCISRTVSNNDLSHLVRFDLLLLFVISAFNILYTRWFILKISWTHFFNTMSNYISWMWTMHWNHDNVAYTRIDGMAHRCLTSDLMATLTYFTASPQAVGDHQSPSKQ